MLEWTKFQSEPTQSSACCCAGPGHYHAIWQFQVIGKFWDQKFNMPIKARHNCPTQLTNWPQLPQQPDHACQHSAVSYIKHRSISNSGADHQEPSTLLTDQCDKLFYFCAIFMLC